MIGWKTILGLIGIVLCALGLFLENNRCTAAGALCIGAVVVVA